jgi:pSer/pThr/pTyr-binding forkhead associated (FHA) protein
MKRPPVIVVQLIHISGPLKGEIQEFTEGTVSIGRHSSCQVRFPADITSISRKHAEIIREGNQFKLIDHSTNGTFVNGKRGKKETFLKTGDVLIFSEGGPKVSFLTQIKEDQVESIPSPRQEPVKEPVREHVREPVIKPAKEPIKESIKEPERKPVREPAPPLEEKQSIIQQVIKSRDEQYIRTVKVPLAIQYGPTLRSFKELPVTIGKSSKCGFTIDHPAILDEHVQIFFSQNQYWIKDLTGQNLIQINNQPISFQASLKIDDNISLSPRGPVLRFLGEGRFVEVVEPAVRKPSSYNSKKERISQQEIPEEKPSKGFLSKLQKYWDSKSH